MDSFEEEEKAAGLDPVAMLRSFWRRKSLFFVPFIICLTMAGLVIRTMPPIYYSSAQVRVIMNANAVNMLQDRSFGRENQRDREALVNINTIVTGPKFLQSIVRELDLHRNLMTSPQMLAIDSAERENAAIIAGAASLRRKVRVSPNGTHLFEIGVRDLNPQRAFTLAREILDKFLEEERASRLQPSTQTRDFLLERRTRLAEQLDEAEIELAEFQRGLMSRDLAGSVVNEGNIALAENELRRLSQLEEDGSGEFLRLEQRAAAILGDAPGLDAVTRTAAISLVMRDLVDVELEQSHNRITQFVEGHTGGGSLRLRLNDLITGFVDQTYSLRSYSERNSLTEYIYQLTYRDVRLQVVNRLSGELEEFRAFRTSQPEQAATLVRLQEQVETAQSMVTAIDRQITQEDIRVEASMAEIGYRIVVRRDPLLPLIPSEPDKIKLAIMGFILSMGLGIGLVVLATMLDRSLRSVAAIEALTGVRVIGTLPVVSNPQFEAYKRRRGWIWFLVVLGIGSIAAFGFLYVYPRLG